MHLPEAPRGGLVDAVVDGLVIRLLPDARHAVIHLVAVRQLVDALETPLVRLPPRVNAGAVRLKPGGKQQHLYVSNVIYELRKMYFPLPVLKKQKVLPSMSVITIRIP